MMKKSGRIALCGVTAALGVVLLLLTGVIPIATVALPALAGVVTIPVVAELGIKYGLSVYGVCSVFALLLAPDREAALYYVLFFGYYPGICACFLKIQNRLLRTLLKFSVFNVAMVVETLLALYVLHLPFESLFLFGKIGLAVVAVLFNVVFYLYDRCMPGLVLLYYDKLHRPLMRIFNGKQG